METWNDPGNRTSVRDAKKNNNNNQNGWIFLLNRHIRNQSDLSGIMDREELILDLYSYSEKLAKYGPWIQKGKLTAQCADEKKPLISHRNHLHDVGNMLQTERVESSSCCTRPPCLALWSPPVCRLMAQACRAHKAGHTRMTACLLMEQTAFPMHPYTLQ